MDKNTHTHITRIIEEVMGFSIATLEPAKKLNTISEWDSFNNLMLISRLEEEFKIQFTAVEIERADTIQSIYALVDKKLNEK